MYCVTVFWQQEMYVSTLRHNLGQLGLHTHTIPVLLRQNTVAQFIAKRPILGLWEVAERWRGTRVPQRWWEQSGIDWSLAREKAAAAAEQAEENAEDTETPGSGAEADLEPAPTTGWTADGIREEASLGVSGSRGAEWSGAEY